MSKKSRVTIYDVASRANVSIATVSRFLNTPERVSVETKKRILESIDELGFVPKASARALARKQIGRIGVITPFFTAASFVERLRGISEALVDTEYEFTIYPVDSLERLDGYYSTLPLNQNVDGLIIVSLPINESQAARLRQNQIPAVFIENQVQGFSSIEIDDAFGGRLAAEHLLSQGHTNIAYLGDHGLPDYALQPESSRLDGFQHTLMQHGHPLRPEFIGETHYPPKNPDITILEILSNDHPPTAFFAATDDLAMRILKIANSQSIKIPEELAVVGFDDIPIAEYLDLTTISQSLYASGRMAVRLLVEQMEDPSNPIHSINFQLKVIQRGTA